MTLKELKDFFDENDIPEDTDLGVVGHFGEWYPFRFSFDRFSKKNKMYAHNDFDALGFHIPDIGPTPD